MLGKFFQGPTDYKNMQINNQSFPEYVNKKQNVQIYSAARMYFPWPQVVAALSILILTFLSKTIFEELTQVVEMAINDES
jgi:hypothetical protein